MAVPHYEGDVNALWEGDNRLADVVTYTSPSINNFWFEALYQAEKTAEGDSAFSSGVFYGDRRLKKTNFYAGLSHDVDVNDYDVTRAITMFKLAGAKITGVYHTEEPDGGGESRSGYLVNLSYVIGKIDYRVQYQTMEDDLTYSIGADYRFTDRFKLYTWYTKIDKEDVEDNDYLAVGFQYDFFVPY
ncbi:porin [Alteromonas sp. H39]|uniref:porin n=1 Tax=Alteromonas sp. H39 TaxID=3389876 RepID=UPI0039DF5CBF